MAPGSGVRRRKKGEVREDQQNHLRDNRKENSVVGTVETTPIQEGGESNDNESFLQVVKRHPLTYVLAFLGVPYALWVLYRFICLQKPLGGMRPPVGLTDERQLLILGSMSSGTSSTARHLSQILEIGHEDSDTRWKFVRDGTVSWFHGIRFWPAEQRSHRIQQICKVQYTFYATNSLSDNYGFGPTLFGTPQYNCSWYQQAPSIPPTCYRHACEAALQREYACVASGDCVTPYRYTLVQAREPWKVVASLTAKYCYSDGIVDKKLPLALQLLLLALGTSSGFGDHCVVQIADYVAGYYGHLLDAGVPFFRIEDVPRAPRAAACHVLRLAGLGRPETTVYAPNHEAFQRACERGAEEGESDNQAHANVINRGRVTREMVLEHATEESIQKIKRLYQRLEYEYPT